MSYNPSAVAAFIGARLQHPVPQCNSSNPRVSTIRVDQYKSKFDDVRVYCTLAHEDEVQKAWSEDMTKCHATGLDELVKFAHPQQEFIDACWSRDARHYRQCYIDMVKLVAWEHVASITGCADHSLLLQNNEEELDESIAYFVKIGWLPCISTKEFASWEELKSTVMSVMKATR